MIEPENTLCPRIGIHQWSCAPEECTCHLRERARQRASAPCGTPDQYGWTCCGSDPCKRIAPVEPCPNCGRSTCDNDCAPTNLTFDDVERISESADKYDRIAAAIESDSEWFVDDSIDDADIAKGLRLAAKALRNGVQP